MIRKRFGLVLICIISCFASVVKAADVEVEDSVSFTLEEAIIYAKQHNRDVTVADLAQQIARRQTQEYVATGLPQINAQFAQDYNYKLGVMVMNTPEGPQHITMGQPYSGNSTVQLSQMLFDGSFFVGLKAARTFQELSVKQETQTEIDVVELVTKAYFLVLVNEESRQAIQRNHERLAQLLEETDKMFQNGFAEKMDVDRIKVQLNNAEVELNQNKQETEVSRMMLKFQMGFPLEYEMRLSEDLDSQGYQEVLAESMNEFSYQNRIEYSIMSTQERLKHLEIKENNSRYFPKIDLIASYGYLNFGEDFRSSFDVSKWSAQGAIGLKMTVPVFDGLYKHRTHQKMKLERQQLMVQQLALKDNITIEVKQSQNKLVTNVRTVEIQKDNMELAQEVYRHAVAKYQRGIGSNLEVIEADGDLKQAQNNYYQALYSALVAKVELQKAIGALN
ncbi:TolC family protein [Persicobacter diffluens]|uniref:Transporter n=1 Tax=Persicobacter diffluens TaxID=981 RepID=A0AAN4W048_9BACT|nr:transporter [Persicobacter diffluens]